MTENVISIFNKYVYSRPNKIALKDERCSLSYKELDEYSNYLSAEIQKKGIGIGDIVGIEAEKKVETVIGMLAILKAGAAYLPIDANYPKKRIKFMLEDTKCKLVLTYDINNQLYKGISSINLESNKKSEKDLKITCDRHTMAYVIYTSGTTGQPKGVVVEHGNIINLVKKSNYFNETNLVIGQAGSLAFDATTFEIWGALLNGGEIYIYSTNAIGDVEQFKRALIINKINTLFITVALFNQFLSLDEKVFDSLDQLFTGGEAVTEKYVNMLAARNQVGHFCNIYGPTETTTFATFYPITKSTKGNKTPIGKPISNVSTYVLKENMSMCKTGEIGELFIGGEGVARGYLNRPELTKEKFVYAPWNKKERLYKTGDIVKELHTGDLEFVGRVDNQVKIHGFRIELEEIEKAVKSVPGIQETIVKVFGDGNDKKMCAFFKAEDLVSTENIILELEKKLPPYMIPYRFIQVEDFKLTSNKKIDRSLLLETELENDSQVDEVLSKEEERVAEVFTEILGNQRINSKSNFFELGGDSIKAIRMVSKFRDLGYEISISTILQNKTVKEIAERLKYKKNVLIPQEMIIGEIGYTPIQKQFFSSNLAYPSHFNQSVLFESKKRIEEEKLNIVIKSLFLHHDMLRTIFIKGKQKVRSIEDIKVPMVEVIEISEGLEEIRRINGQYQKKVNLEKGELSTITIFRAKDVDYLLFCIHHLIVDGISWRIIAEDLNQGYRQILDRKEINFSEKTNSFQKWSQELIKYSKSKAISKEIEYWKNVEGLVKKSKPENSTFRERSRNTKTKTFKLEKEFTKSLGENVGSVYNAEINDVLLTGVFRTLKKIWGKQALSVLIEGHGREKIKEDFPIDRTVGWFTTIYPVALEYLNNDIGKNVCTVKETLRKIPNHGIGYTVMRWLKDEELEGISPDVTFNYLGDFSKERDDNQIKILETDFGDQVSEKNDFGSNIVIDTVIIEDNLNIEIQFNSNEYQEPFIENMGLIFLNEMKKVITHCLKQEKTIWTQSDFNEKEWTEIEFRNVMKEMEEKEQFIQDICPLTPLQEGMLFHKMNDDESLAYTVQCKWETKKKIDVSILKQALYILANTHPILKTSIVYENVSVPRQVMLENREIEVNVEDINSSEEDKLNLILKNDLSRGFDLQNDSLIRITFLNKDEGNMLIATFHHIIMDGWCISILMNDLSNIYNELTNKKELHIEPKNTANKEHSFYDFVRKQIACDNANAIKYWDQLLEGYETPAEIKNHLLSETLKEEESNTVTYTIDSVLLNNIKRICRENNLTVNTFLEASWGLLLQKYNRTNDVVFGKIVSGRNADIKNIDKLVGLFINTIPVRIKSENMMTFMDILKATQSQAIESADFDNCPLSIIQKNHDIGSNLIKTLIGFENYTAENEPENQVFELKEIREETNYDLNLDIQSNKSLKLILMYNNRKYSQENAKRILAHFRGILNTVSDEPNSLIDNIDMLSEKEKNSIIKDFRYGEVYPIKDCTLVDMFEEAAKIYPDNIVLYCGNSELSYRELNERANYLGNKIVQHGIETEDVVGIMVKDAASRLISIIAVLKAGGTFLPLDEKHPDERISYMASDSNMKLLICDTEDYNKVNVSRISAKCDCKQESNLNKKLDASNLSYIIYTSGTTGNPKGVMVEHKNVVNLCCWQSIYGSYSEHTIMVNNFNYIFDGSIWEIFPAITSGAAIYTYSLEERNNIEFIIKNIKGKQMMLVPSMFRTVLDFVIENKKDNEFNGFEKLYLGAEELTYDLLDKYIDSNGNHVEDIYNLYGPTECTVCSTAYNFTNHKGKTIPIGKPIWNAQAFILTSSNALCGIGVPGELCIGGSGVARGYINNIQMTKEKFVELEGDEKTRIYKTGDLACWDEKGNIIFLGRIDDQVKVNGFRIELNEIENKLRGVEGIIDALVCIKELQETKILAAYILGEKTLETKEINEHLAKVLPHYMIPQFYMQLECFPRASSGKISKKLLPEFTFKESKNMYEQVMNKKEEIVHEIFSEILGVYDVGRNGNFFACGGDSIKAIRMIPRFKERGFKVSIDDIMSGKTIKNIANKMVCDGSMEIDNSEVSGETKLSPIQKLFFEKCKHTYNYFNFSTILRCKRKINKNNLEEALAAVVKHHDILRAQYIDKKQYIRKFEEIKPPHLDIVDLSMEYKNTVEDKVCDYSQKLQESFDISKDILIKGILFQTSDGEFLFLCAHHLVVDGVSWRVIIEDLETSYELVECGKSIILPNKTNSFQLWTHYLASDSYKETQNNNQEYWDTIQSRLGKSQLKLPQKGNDEYKIQVLKRTIDGLNIDKLVGIAGEEISLEINDLLLTALIRGVNQVIPQPEMCITLEGHGRENINNTINVERTVGWFTNIFPVILPYKETLLENIISIKETLRRVPNKGMGFMSRENKDVNTPLLAFNYLGQFELSNEGKDIFEDSDIDHGKDIYEKTEFANDISIDCYIKNEKFYVEISYNQSLYELGTISHLLKTFSDSIKEVVNYCSQIIEPYYTCSDYGEYEWNDQDFLSFVQKCKQNGWKVSRVFPLTHMQEGMLYHKILNEKSTQYFVQGWKDSEKIIDETHFKKATEILTDYHKVLKTAILYKGMDIPRQIIVENRYPECEFIDINGDVEQHIKRIKDEDIKRGFDLEQDSLLRFKILCLENQKNIIYVSFHHIIMDGWCLSLLEESLWNIYNSLINGEPSNNIKKTLPDIPTYENFVRYMVEKNEKKGLEYWKKILAGYNGTAKIAPSNQSNSDEKTQMLMQKEHIYQDMTEKLRQFSKKNNVTINSIIEACIGILMQKYYNCQDIVFGKVVSGRNRAINNIHKVIGLFINTIPIRVTNKGTFLNTVTDIQKQSIESSNFDYCSLAEIQKECSQGKDIIHMLLAYENYSSGESINEWKGVREETNYPLTISVMEGNELTFEIYHDNMIFNTTQIKTLMNYLKKIIEQVCDNYNINIDEIICVNKTEIEKLKAKSDEIASVEFQKTLVERLKEQAHLHKNEVAVQTKTETISYAMLDKATDILARKIRERNTNNKKFVGIIVDRNIETIIGIVGIIKAGVAYMPIERKYPEARIKYMMEDSETDLLLYSGNCDVKCGERLEIDIDDLLALENHEKYYKDELSDQAYLIYTSGSTGKPKGVVVNRESIVNLVVDSNYVKLADARLLQTGSLAFDASTFEIWGALLNGSLLYMADEEVLFNTHKMKDVIKNNSLNTMFITTALFNQLLDIDNEVFNDLEQLYFGGESATEKYVGLLAEQKSKIKFYNIYGPTETTTFALFYEINKRNISSKTPIGKPIKNMLAYIMQKNMLCGCDMIGELCIEGKGVSQGYLNNALLTSSKFETNPYTNRKMYRTGDLCRELPDGNIEYIGRNDSQVKIHGFRMELGEIENKIKKVSSIKDAIVITQGDGNEKELCAYYLADEEIEKKSLQYDLKQWLPDYMIPNYFMRLSEFPISVNGKIDKKLLPVPEEVFDVYEPPIDEIEEEVVRIFEKVLKTKNIGRKDHFFERGGHSLTATKVLNLLSNIFQCQLSIKTIFDYPIVCELADIIRNGECIETMSLLPENVEEI